MRTPKLSYLTLALVLIGCSSTEDDPGPEDMTDPTLDGLALQSSLPQYTAQGELVRRDDWPQWVFLGASLNLSYTEAPPAGDFFANVFMEPSAFEFFEQTGTFRDGTMTAAAAYLASSDVAPAVGGLFAGDQVVFEMSIRDSAVDAEVPWRYYSFAGEAVSAPANPREACFDCHTEHAATDHVFTQFYPVLRATSVVEP